MVKNLLTLLYSRQSSILSGATIIMATVLISKVLGLIRDRLLVATFSPDTVALFFAAFRIPDLLFQLLVFGALSVAFIPVFTEYLERGGRDEAFKLAQSILNSTLLILIGVTVIIYFFVTPLTSWIVPGFSAHQQLQTASLTRIILIGQIILAVGLFFVGILQSFQRFIIPALAGVFYNFGIILGIIILAKPLGIFGAAIGVIIGALLHMLFQLPLILSVGFKFDITRLFHKGILEIGKLASIRTLGLASEQVNETVGVILASIISTASVTYLTFAQHLQLVPVSLFGATIAQVALPILSYERARSRMDEFKTTLLTTMHQILFLVLPAAAILIVLRIPAVRLTFGAAQFDWPSTVLTGKTLAYLSIGLAAQSISLLLVRSFYALKDTKTPVLVSFATVILNIMLSFYFVVGLHLHVGYLGLAFSLANIFSAISLFLTLHFKIGGFDLKKVFVPLIKMTMATTIMGVALYVPIKLLDAVIFDTTRTINLLVLTGISSAFALSVYISLVWYMKVRELTTFVDLLKRSTKFQTLLKPKEIIQDSGTV